MRTRTRRSRNRKSGSKDEALQPRKARKARKARKTDGESKKSLKREDKTTGHGSNDNNEEKNVADDGAAVMEGSDDEHVSDKGAEKGSGNAESGDDVAADKGGNAKLNNKSMEDDDNKGTDKEDKPSAPQSPTGTLSKLAPKPAPPSSYPPGPPQPYAPYYPGYPSPYCQYYSLPQGMPMSHPMYPYYPPAPLMHPPPTAPKHSGSGSPGKTDTASPWNRNAPPITPSQYPIIPRANTELPPYVDASTLPDPTPDDRRNRGGVAEPFPDKLHRMLEYTENNGWGHVAAFSPHGRAFVIRKPNLFVKEIMGKFFRQTRLTSFQRQLNLYGFKRISQGPDSGGYYHELFLRGRPGLSINMQRTKIKGDAAQRFRKDPDNEPNFYAMPPVSVPESTSSGDGSEPGSPVKTAIPTPPDAAAMPNAVAEATGGPIAPAPKPRMAKVDPSQPVAQTPASDALSADSTARASPSSKAAVTMHDAAAPPSASKPAPVPIAPQMPHPPTMYPMPTPHQHPQYAMPYGYFYPTMPMHPAPYTAAQQEPSSPSPSTPSMVAPVGQPGGPVMVLPNYSPYPGYHCPPYYQYPFQTSHHQGSGAPPLSSAKKSSTEEDAGKSKEDKMAKKQAEKGKEDDLDLVANNAKREDSSGKCDPVTDQKEDASASSTASAESPGAE